jgi:hypothetical protein
MADSDFYSAETNRPSGSSRRTNWKKGDRVLAPWEPTFLYAGTIQEVKGGQALIQFDDGDAGSVDLALVQPLALQLGQKVMSRRRMGPHFFPGEISKIEGVHVHIEFDDGKEERTTVAALRIPCQPQGRGADQLKSISHMAFLEHLEEGSRVWALWKNSALFPGTVSELRGREAHIDFDDGDQDWVQVEHLMPLDLMIGMFVMGRWKMGQQFFPGRITDTEGDRVHIRYEDGDEEWTTAEALALPIPSQQPAATNAQPAPSPVMKGWDPHTVLWIGAVAVAAVAGLFFWLGRQ